MNKRPPDMVAIEHWWNVNRFHYPDVTANLMFSCWDIYSGSGTYRCGGRTFEYFKDTVAALQHEQTTNKNTINTHKL